MAMRGIAPHWRAFPAALLTILVLAILVSPTLVSGSQDVSITSGSGGSILTIVGDDAVEKVTLTPAGSNLAIKGFFDGPTPEQCTVVTDRKNIQCPMSAFNSVSIDMGGGNDAVIVAGALPVPVTANMGAGNDAFTGLDEVDTCIGGDGDDGCTTGAGNDSCDMGAGEDHCNMGGGSDTCILGAGIDGCSGGAGPDTCKGLAGRDRCRGDENNDLLIGGFAHDAEVGGSGRDKCDPSPGHDALNDCEVVLP
jgi:Ca2+-binding RTX toxin-like protein